MKEVSPNQRKSPIHPFTWYLNVRSTRVSLDLALIHGSYVSTLRLNIKGVLATLSLKISYIVLTAIFRNCSFVLGGKCRRLKRDCKGLDSRLISLQVANTLAPEVTVRKRDYNDFMVTAKLAYDASGVACDASCRAFDYDGMVSYNLRPLLMKSL